MNEAQMSTDEGGSSPVAKMQSPSSMKRVLSLDLTDSRSESVSQSKLWSISGGGPIRQVSMLLASAFCLILSCQSLSLQPEQHRGGYLDILTSPLTNQFLDYVSGARNAQVIIFGHLGQ